MAGESVGRGYISVSYTHLGGEIFDNLEVVKLSDEEVKSFDNIKCGVDFGFAADPFVYVVCFYHNNKLFIFDEIYAKGMTNHNAAEKIFEKGFANKLIVCDSCLLYTSRCV